MGQPTQPTERAPKGFLPAIQCNTTIAWRASAWWCLAWFADVVLIDTSLCTRHAAHRITTRTQAYLRMYKHTNSTSNKKNDRKKDEVFDLADNRTGLAVGDPRLAFQSTPVQPMDCSASNDRGRQTTHSQSNDKSPSLLGGWVRTSYVCMYRYVPVCMYVCHVLDRVSDACTVSYTHLTLPTKRIV